MGHKRERWRARNVGAPYVAALLLLATLATSSLSAGAGAAQSSRDDGATPILVTRAGLSQFVYVLWSMSCGTLDCFRLQRLDASDHGSGPILPTPLARSKNYYSDGGLEQLVFANVDDGYALVSSPRGESPTLYATFDGARTWHREALVKDETPESITASQDAFYIVGALKCPTAHASCEIWRISRSPVGSHHWAAVSRPYNFTHEANYPFVAAFGSHVFITTQEQGKPYHTLFGASDNDGRSFKVDVVPNLVSVNGCEVRATSELTIWAECDDGMMSGEIEISTDGGDHWRTLNLGPQGTRFEIGTIDSVSSDVTYLDNGLDAGQLWRLGDEADKSTLAGALPYPHVATLAFTNVTQGFALSTPIGPKSRQVLYETIDAGKHWKRLIM